MRTAGRRGPSGPSARSRAAQAPSRGAGHVTPPATPAAEPPSRPGSAAWANATAEVCDEKCREKKTIALCHAVGTFVYFVQ